MKRTLGPTPPDPGILFCLPCMVAGASLLGVFLPERPLLERATALLLIAVAALATAHRRRDPAHRPIEVGVSVMTAADSINACLRSSVLTGGPYYGLARAAFHVGEGVTLAGTFALPLMAGAVLLQDGRRARLLRTLLVSLAALLLVVMVVGYPDVRTLPLPDRSQWLRLRYLAAEMVALFVTSVVVWRTWRPKDGRPTAAEISVIGLLVGGLVLFLVGAWDRGLFGAAYSVHQAGLAAMYLVLVLVHARALGGDGRSGA